MEISKYIDHTLLKPDATQEDIMTLCQEAEQHNFYAVCVNGSHVYEAKRRLFNTEVKVASVVGFPLGANSTDVKVFEAKEAISDGADEIDMVLNIGWLKARRFDLVEDEITRMKRNIGERVLKVIFEICYLDNELIDEATKICIRANADFIKTSTGFGTHGATEEAVKIMNSSANNQIKIKASGGIRNLRDLRMYIELGASRIGTSSGVKIMNNL